MDRKNVCSVLLLGTMLLRQIRREMMRERLEEFESIPRKETCNQPYSLAVCSATYFRRFGAWANSNIGDLLLNSFPKVSTP